MEIREITDRRMKPHRQPLPFQLNSRDVELFEWLVGCSVMTRDHIARLWGIGHSGVSKRLRKLEAEGYITTRHVLQNFPALVTATAKASAMTRWHTITDAGNRTGDLKPVKLNSFSSITHDLLVMDVAVTYAAIGAGVVPERIMRWADRGKVMTTYVIGANYFPDLIVGSRSRNDPNLLTASHRTRLSYTGAWRTRDKTTTTELRELYPAYKDGTFAVEVERSRKTTTRYTETMREYQLAMSPLLGETPQTDIRALVWMVADTGTRTRIATVWRSLHERDPERRVPGGVRPLTPWLAPPSL